ncbi:Sugar or nucleoside kinase, ribokinase family [Actinacidiphila alni]|uniref:Sugar or nucleoside kinase, ribokinase family n=1 Tax=Actinacidiphila alni TaxID=380248 RepID=A0A1I2AEW3_9ACTN|nr:sugar kinase [Actinacidiphila alni]SFE42412.1 Sugar or nucleoside kinase, ribokinase family [Actinacidiphila alni]
MPDTFDLLVIGDANPDIVLGPLDAPLAFGQREQLVPTGLLTLGGSAAIMACGAARLGLKVAIAGRIGDDDTGRYVRTALAERGVDTGALRVDPAAATPLTAVLTRGDDRAILTAPGTLATTRGEDVPSELLGACRHVHAASYFLLPQLAGALPDLFRTARAHGATTSLDTNDDPAGAWDPRGLAALLPVTDILLPNAREACALAASTDPGAPVPDGDPKPADVERAAGALTARGPLVVVKNGADGALAHDGRAALHAPAVPVRPVDTVGAGDSFDAGFVAATLAGLPLADALAFAAACGALSTRAHGGTPAQATWDDAMSHVVTTRNGENPS